MSPKFSFKSGLLSLSLSAAAAFAVLTPAPEAQAGDKAVNCGDLKDIKAFCDTVQGKHAAIKRVMKDAEKAYKAAGKGDIGCKTCHETGSGGALNDKSKELWPAYKPFVETAIKAYKPKE
jgi:hypothetical protein